MNFNPFKKTEAQKLQETRQKANQLKTKQEVYEARQKGYRKGQLETAEKRGYEEGKKSQGGFMSAGIGGSLAALGGSINRTEKAFGFSSGSQLGSNLDIFSNPSFGMGGSQKQQQPVEKVRVSRKGDVTITRPVQNTQKKKQASPYDWMNMSDDENILGF